MSFTGAVKKVTKVKKSIWDVEGLSASDRIQERRERIKKRIEAAKKMQKLMRMKKALVGFKEFEDDMKLKEFVKDAFDEGENNISNIEASGQEVVSNIALSSKNIQVKHRQTKNKKAHELKKILEDEDAEMEKMFEGIVSTWPTQSERLKGAPTQLFEEILQQKEMCNKLLQSKNIIIELLEAESRAVDESYKALVEDYHTNMSVLSGRMEYHAKVVEDMFQSERNNLDKAFANQKNDQLKKGESDWMNLLDGAADKSKDHMQARLDLVEEQEQEMNEVIINDYEHLGEAKESMEKNIRSIEEQIGMVQAITHLNCERLDYEIHVLNKHEEENSLIKSEQKRKITFLQDTANKLKSKVKDAERNTEKEQSQLVENIKTIKTQLADLELKQKKFGIRSEKTRTEMATMMKTEAFNLLEKLNKNDEILQTLYLNRPFKESSQTNLDTKKMLDRLESQRPSIASTQQLLPKLSRGSTPRKLSLRSEERFKNEKNARKMLLTLIEKANFLVDEDLDALMAVLPDKDKLLLTVDSILGALGIQDTDGIDNIFHHLTIGGKNQEHFEELSAEKEKVFGNAEKRSKLLKALREYVEEPEKEEKMHQKQQAMFGTLSILQSVAGAIKPDREGHLWDELKESIEIFKSPDRVHLKNLLTEYKDVLLARSDLIKRNNQIRAQNTELRTLLKDYLQG